MSGALEASTAQPALPPAGQGQSANPSSQPERGSGGRRRPNPNFGPRAGFGGSRAGNTGRGRGGHSSANGQPRPPGTRPGQPPTGRAAFGAKLTDQTKLSEAERRTIGQTSSTDDAGADPDAEVCFICASRVIHNAISPCNHRTCHICALRLRALYKSKACAHCRTEAERVIFTDDTSKRFEQFDEADFARVDDNLGINYEKADIFEDTVLLLRYNCPDSSCDVACLGWPDLHRHVKTVHHKIMCDLCTRNKKVFTHEHELFTINELRRHEKFGDDNPGAVDQSGFKGHPECGFCRERFYGDDELYAHCRDKHERCHICDRRNQGSQPQYYVDYNSLEKHFRSQHFLCTDRECLEKKFVVFDSEIDFKAHQLEAHPHDLSKDARRDARRIDISGFDPRRPPPQSSRGGRGDGRPGGRGRDPNLEPIPQSTAQPLRRDELAYQRQMAIQSAQSASTRTFGGQLTSTDVPNTRPSQRGEDRSNRRPRPDTTQPSPPSLASLSIGQSQASGTPAEQARALRHAAVITRASNLLRNDPSKISTFRAKISQFRASSITAPALIDAFFSLFDLSSSKDLGKLINELAEIFEIESKRNDLLKAWNDWRAINEDYPALPGPSGPGSSTAAAVAASANTTLGGGSRVLKLKSSTAQSSRSQVSRQGSWGSASSASGMNPGSADPFPPVSQSNPRAPGPNSTWTPVSSRNNVSLSTALNSLSSSRPTASNAPKPKPPSSGGEAFPALPAAAKPAMPAFNSYSGRAVRRDMNNLSGSGRSTPQSVWASGGSNSNGDSGNASEENEGGQNGGKKKGRQAKKQTLLQWG